MKQSNGVSFMNSINLLRILLILWGLLLLVVLLPTMSYAQTEYHAGIVVSFADGVDEYRCVPFTSDQITGYQLLDLTDLTVSAEYSGLGSAICGIQQTGCTVSQDSCFCECTGNECMYWSYWLQENGAWTYSTLGSSAITVRDGDVQGWSWSEGALNTSASRQPPLLTFDQICSAEILSGTETISPTVTATSDGTNQPTATWSPTWTETPTVRSSTSTPTPVTATLEPTPGPTPTPTETPILPPTIRVFGVDRSPIPYGETATILWDVVNANSVLLRYPGGEEMVAAQDSRQVTPEVSTAYTIFAASSVGEAEQTVLVEVEAQFSAPTAPPEAAAPPVVEAPTATETPIWTLTSMPTETSTPTWTPMPTETATSEAPVQSPLELPETAALASVPEEQSAEAESATPATVVVTATVASEPADQATAPPVTLIVPGENLEAASAPVSDTERAFAASGILFVIGAPLLFAGIWLLVWYIMRRT